MKNIKNIFTQPLKQAFYVFTLVGASIVIIVCALAVNHFVLSWTEPTSPPPTGFSPQKPYSLSAHDGDPDPALYVDDNGNVGIGTNNPGAKLAINNSYSNTGAQTVRIATAVGAPGTVVDALHIDAYPDTAYDKGVAISMGLKNSVFGEYTSRIVHYGFVSHTRASKLQLQTHSNSPGVWNTGILIDDNGNVGIGTTNPGEKLDVNGNVKGSRLCIGTDCRASWPSGISYCYVYRSTSLSSCNCPAGETKKKDLGKWGYCYKFYGGGDYRHIFRPAGLTCNDLDPALVPDNMDKGLSCVCCK